VFRSQSLVYGLDVAVAVREEMKSNLDSNTSGQDTALRYDVIE